MRWLWVGFAISMVAGVYFTPPPLPGEPAMAYVLAGRQTWQSTAATISMSFCGALLLMGYLMRDPNR